MSSSGAHQPDSVGTVHIDEIMYGFMLDVIPEAGALEDIIDENMSALTKVTLLERVVSPRAIITMEQDSGDDRFSVYFTLEHPLEASDNIKISASGACFTNMDEAKDVVADKVLTILLFLFPERFPVQFGFAWDRIREAAFIAHDAIRRWLEEDDKDDPWKNLTPMAPLLRLPFFSVRCSPQLAAGPGICFASESPAERQDRIGRVIHEIIKYCDRAENGKWIVSEAGEQEKTFLQTHVEPGGLRQIIEDNHDIFLVREDGTTWYVELQTRPKMSSHSTLEVASPNSKCQASSGQTLLAESEGAGQQRADCKPEHPRKKMKFFLGEANQPPQQLSGNLTAKSSSPSPQQFFGNPAANAPPAKLAPVPKMLPLNPWYVIRASSGAGSEPKRPPPPCPRYD